MEITEQEITEQEIGKKKVRIFISGMPGSGKTTLINEIINQLTKMKKKVIGFTTPEIKEIKNRKRKGFFIKSLASGKQYIMASIDRAENKIENSKSSTENKDKNEGKIAMFGKYKVNISAIEKIVDEIRNEIKNAEIIVIDEIGRMEFLSNSFKALINELMKIDKIFDKILLATLHRKYLAEYKAKYKDKGLFFWLTKENFQSIKKEIIKLIS